MKNPGKITRENILYHRNIDSYSISSVIAFRWPGWRDGRIHAVSLSAFHSTEPNCSGVLNDVGTEELAHLEMVSTIVHQLTCNLSLEEIQNSGFANYYVDHTAGIWPQAAGGVPFNSCEFQSKGDPLTDLFEDLAAEQKARSTYDNILRLVKDPEVADPIRFLRAREVVHFQRFGEALRSVQDELNSKNFYAFNPSFDAKTFCAAPQPGAGQGNCCTR